MYKVKLTEKDISDMNVLKKTYSRDWKILRRLRTIEQANQWEKNRKIAEKIDVNVNQITRRIKQYQNEWLIWLCWLKYDGRRKSEYEKYAVEIEQMVDENIYGSYAELYEDICNKFEISVWLDALWKFCKKNEILAIRSAV